MDAIELLPGGIDLEVVGGPAVERRVQVELDRVAFDEAVAPAQRRRHARRVVADCAEVEVVVVPEHAKGRADGRGAAFVRADLHELIFQRRGLPGGFVHAAIDLDVAASSPRRMRGAAFQLARHRLRRVPRLAQPRIHHGPDLRFRPACLLAAHTIQYETKHELAVIGPDVIPDSGAAAGHGQAQTVTWPGG